MRLNKLNICVSHTSTIKTIAKLGTDHDKPVQEWRDKLAKCICDNNNCLNEVCLNEV